AEVLDLAGGLQGAQRGHALADRYFRVHLMEEVEVNARHLEPRQAPLHRAREILWRGVQAALARRADDDAAFRGDHDPAAVWRQHLADRPLARLARVAVGRVHEAHAQLHRAAEHGARRRVVADTIRAKPHPKDRQIAADGNRRRRAARRTLHPRSSTARCQSAGSPSSYRWLARARSVCVARWPRTPGAGMACYDRASERGFRAAERQREERRWRSTASASWTATCTSWSPPTCGSGTSSRASAT